VCYDTDFCAKCEALPTNTHNRTHPLVMFKTPIRSVNISMMNEDDDGRYLATLGDRSQKSTSTQADAPIERDELQPKAVDASAPEKVETSGEEEQVKAEMPASEPSGYGYDAFFIREAIADGTVIAPNQVFQQTWTLYNPGPLAWPAGSDVRFVGGDSMFDVDTGRASSIDSITSAMGSNKLSAPLEPGQSAQFTVTLRAPNREGTAISYWRLKLANGMPFGHRLWCDVRVQGGPAEPEKAASDGKGADAKQDEGTGSCMIFPTLDKESPETSTHGAMAGPAAPSVSNPSENDVVEDMESLTMGEDGTEGGFVTDEEYDVLDASDQEFQDAKAQK
jgi:next-to-BRCA1 protein 1